jgi:hypothetical protein
MENLELQQLQLTEMQSKDLQKKKLFTNIFLFLLSLLFLLCTCQLATKEKKFCCNNKHDFLQARIQFLILLQNGKLGVAAVATYSNAEKGLAKK